MVWPRRGGSLRLRGDRPPRRPPRRPLRGPRTRPPGRPPPLRRPRSRRRPRPQPPTRPRLPIHEPAFSAGIAFLGIRASPSFVREPQGNGVAERFIRTLKDSSSGSVTSITVEELNQVLQEWRILYNERWLAQRHRHPFPRTGPARAHAPPRRSVITTNSLSEKSGALHNRLPRRDRQFPFQFAPPSKRRAFPPSGTDSRRLSSAKKRSIGCLPQTAINGSVVEVAEGIGDRVGMYLPVFVDGVRPGFSGFFRRIQGMEGQPCRGSSRAGRVP